MAIADNSKVQTPQGLFGGYAPCTVPGIGIRNADVVQKLKEGTDRNLDVTETLTERWIEGQWEVEFFGRSVRPYNEGDVMAFGFSAGGAGYGDPLEADPESVAEDVINQIISNETALDIYKVVFDEKAQKVDLEATERLRSAERAARRSRGKPYAAFIKEWEQLKPADEILHAYGSWPDAQPTAPLMRM